MIVTKLQLRHFRNYEKCELTFQKGINFIFGNNAQGKTNLLESIYYLSTTKSHHVTNDLNLIEKNHDFFVVDAKIQQKRGMQHLRIVRNKSGKQLLMNQVSIKKNSQFVGLFNAVMFCPDDLRLFTDTPKVRRRFIDLELSKLSKSYLQALTSYERLLKERNKYLKQERIDVRYLDTLDDQMVTLMATIVHQRMGFLKRLLDDTAAFYQDVSHDGTSLGFIYESCVPYVEDISVLTQNLQQALQQSRSKDLQYRITSMGIHKEDVVFQINGLHLGTYGSQGQKRTAILSIKFGLVLLIKDVIGEYPVLLLDDVFSELDEQRRCTLLDKLQGDVQIFISTTDQIRIDNIDNIQYMYVDAGTVTIV
ncbi:MAG: DNA replication/repair protein RecF [Erysipelotrichaceae bacterium]